MFITFPTQKGSMRVLVFGNQIAKADSAAIKIASRLSGKMPNVEFVHFDTSEDLEKEGRNLVILDVVVGLEKPRVVQLSELELSSNPLSLHGFDLIWNLLLLKKLGKIESATIVGVPAGKPYTKSLRAVKEILEGIAVK
jgi:Ni,Fe-hydrogenase maturation factor